MTLPPLCTLYKNYLAAQSSRITRLVGHCVAEADDTYTPLHTKGVALPATTGYRLPTLFSNPPPIAPFETSFRSNRGTRFTAPFVDPLSSSRSGKRSFWELNCLLSPRPPSRPFPQLEINRRRCCRHLRAVHCCELFCI